MTARHVTQSVVTIELLIESNDDVSGVVDDLLDHGILQDSIHDLAKERAVSK